MASVFAAFLSIIALLGWEKIPNPFNMVFMIFAGVLFGGVSLFVLINAILMHIKYYKKVISPEEKEAIDFIKAIENNKEQLKKIYKEKADKEMLDKLKEKSENDNLAQVQGYKDFDSAPKGS